MNTAARTFEAKDAHWYTKDGTALHEVPKADGKGKTPTTLRHARKMNLLPSVTTILKLLYKPALESWKQEQACLAVLTAPRLKDEGLDAFVHRVLQVEEQHREVAKDAADLGKTLHDQLERAALGLEWDEEEYGPYILPALEIVGGLGNVISAERIVTSKLGFAGCMDFEVHGDDVITVLDSKSTGSIPKDDSWTEHKLQTAAYASTLGDVAPKRIQTANLYISTKEIGKCVLHVQEEWEAAFADGFMPLVRHWQWANGYTPA